MSQPIQATLEFEKTSFVTEEVLTLKLTLPAANTPTLHPNKVANISVDIFKLDVERNQLAFGFGAQPSFENDILTLSKQIPSSAQPGLYIISSMILSDSDGSNQIQVIFPPQIFAIQTYADAKLLTLQEVMEQVNQLEVKRLDYMNQPIWTEQAKAGTGAKPFNVLVFGVGCLIHTKQQLKGFSITPIKMGLSHKRMHDIVNAFLTSEGRSPLELQEQTEQQFERSTPTFVVNYQRVFASSPDDALDFCHQHASTIFQLLGWERGQKPKEFARIAEDLENGNRWHTYQTPWYKGNLISDFDPSSTANVIDRYMAATEKNPFLKLLIHTYTEATAEEIYGFSLLRYWSVVELYVKRIIPKTMPVTEINGSPIMDKKGKPLLSENMADRVYLYVLSTGAYTSSGSYQENGTTKEYIVGDASHPAIKASTEIISPRNIIKAIYSIRNSIAHTGNFDKSSPSNDDEKFAVKLMEAGWGLDPLRYIKTRAQMIIWEEMKNTYLLLPHFLHVIPTQPNLGRFSI